VEDSQIEINREPLWIIRYRHNGQQRHTHKGKSECLSTEEAAHWKVGDMGRLRFGPAKPRESTSAN